MSWWHSDMDVWAGRDGTDLYKPAVDIINAVHERWPLWETLPQLTYYNINGGTDMPFERGTKEPPFTEADLLGMPLHGDFALTARNAVGYVYSYIYAYVYNLAEFPFPNYYGFSKEPDGTGLDDLWTPESFDEATGIEASEIFTPGGSMRVWNAFTLAGAFKWARKILELAIYPVVRFNCEVIRPPRVGRYDVDPGSEFYLVAAEPHTCPIHYPPGDANPWQNFYPGGTIPYTIYGLRGSFSNYHGPCPTPVEAYSIAEAMGDIRSPTSPYSAFGNTHRYYIEAGVIGKRTGAEVLPTVWVRLQVYQFSGPLYVTQTWGIKLEFIGWVIGQQEVKVRFTPGIPELGGTVLKEFIPFNVTTANCPTPVTWQIGGSGFTEKDRIPGYPTSSHFYDAAGLFDPDAAADYWMALSEAMDANPFDGEAHADVYPVTWSGTAPDPLYLLNQFGPSPFPPRHISATGIGSLSVSLGGSDCHAIMSMGYDYV